MGQRNRNKTPWLPPKKQTSFADRKRSNKDIYWSYRWKKDRTAYIAQNPLCVKCKEKGIITEAKVSDHIVPINEGGDIWHWKNRQALCTTCHNIKSAKEAHKNTRS